jgi:hypothetical protein
VQIRAGKAESRAAEASGNAPGDVDYLAVTMPLCGMELECFIKAGCEGAELGVGGIKEKPKLPSAACGENVIDAGMKIR